MDLSNILLQEQKTKAPSTQKNNSNKNNMKGLLQSISKINLCKKDDILPKLTYLLQLLLKVSAKDNYKSLFREPSVKDFFCNNFVPKCTLGIMSYNNPNNDDVLQIINQCLRQVIILCGKAVDKDLPGLLEATSLILNIDDKYYKHVKMSKSRDKEHDHGTSFCFTILINEFGEVGGFDRLYQIRKHAQNSKPINSTISRIFRDCPSDLKSKYTGNIVLSIIDANSDRITEADIDFLVDFYNSSLKPACLLTKIWSFYWNLFTNKNSEILYPGLLQLVQNKFEKLFRGKEFEEQRMKSLCDYIEKLDQTASLGTFSIRIIQKVIESYPDTPNFVQKVKRSAFVKFLCREKSLLRMVINNIIKDSSNSHIKIFMEFLDYILTLAASEGTVIIYDELKDLWNALVCDMHSGLGKTLCLDFVLKFFFTKPEPLMSIEDLELFFENQICSNEMLNCKETIEQDFKFFTTCFMSINKKLGNIEQDKVIHSYWTYNGVTKKSKSKLRLQVLPSQLKGIRSLWKFVLKPKDDAHAKEALQIIKGIYIKSLLTDKLKDQTKEIQNEYISICFEFLENVAKNGIEEDLTNQCLRSLNLIRYAIDKSEEYAFVKLKPYYESPTKCFIKLNLENEISNSSTVATTAEIQVNSNDTLLDLRVKISKHFKLIWNDFRLIRNRTVVKNLFNSYTISEVGFADGEHLKIRRKRPITVPKFSLVDDAFKLSQKMKEVVFIWFEEYSDNGTMTTENFTAFLEQVFPRSFNTDRNAIQTIFETFDEDKDGSLNFDDFVKYFQKICIEKKEVVWKHLREQFYTNDLQKVTDVKPQQLNIVELPRYMIARNHKQFQVLYSLLEMNDKIASQAWKLISKLPTNLELMEDIVSLKKVQDGKQSWDLILDSDSEYKLLYNLAIIDQLMNLDEKALLAKTNKEGSNILSILSENPCLKDHLKSWQDDFANHGGFKYLVSVLNKFSNPKSNTQKSIVFLILKIFANYLSNSSKTKLNKENFLLQRLRNFVKTPVTENLSDRLNKQKSSELQDIIQDLQLISETIREN